MKKQRKAAATCIAAAFITIAALAACGKPAEPPAQEEVGTSAPEMSVDEEALERMLTPYIVQDDAPIPESLPNMSMSDDEAAELVKQMAAAAATCFDKYNETSEFITKNGYLYQWSSRKYLGMRVLTRGGGLDEKYADESPLILYVLPEDMPAIPQNDARANEMTIFAAYERPNGFIVSDAAGVTGEMSKDEMAALLDKYSSNHGDVMRPFAGTEVSNAVGEAVLAFRNDGLGLDVRFLAADEKYALAVCSSKSSQDIKVYFLVCEAGKWRVEITDFEGDYQYRRTITSKYPDVNTSIFPSYDFFYHLKYVRSDYSAIVKAMKESGAIDDEDGEPDFISGTGDFVYATFATGKRFVGQRTEESGWVIHPALTFADAEAFIRERSDDPPTYIIKQE